MNVAPQANGSDNAALIAELQALRETNAKLKAKVEAKATLSFKISEKGALSVYGMGRFPVTLYRGQWERLAKAMPALVDYIEAHASELATKD